MPDALADLSLPRRQVRLSPRVFSPDGEDRGIAGLLTTAAWLLGRLPGMVLEEQRDALVRTLAEAPTIVVEITPTVGVRIKSGDRVLVDLPIALAARQVRGAGKWSRAD